MSPKMKNFIVRAITGALFVAIMVAGLLDPTAMIGLFALITGLALWEYTGLVNNIENVCINRFISTVAGVYLFVAIAGINSGIIQTNAVFVPYLLTVVYLFISELYTRNANAVNDWAYTMLGQMYIALPLACINVLAFRQQPDGTIYYYQSEAHPLDDREAGETLVAVLPPSEQGCYGEHQESAADGAFPRLAGADAGEELVASPSSRVSSSAPWASRTAAASCRATAACSTVSTRRLWPSPHLSSISIHSPYSKR